MKIAMFTSTFPPYRGGMGNVALNEALALAGLGHSVTVVTPLYRKSSAIPERDGQFPFTVRRLKPLVASGNGGLCPGALSEISKVDAVYLHYPFFGTAELLWLDRLFGTTQQARKSRFVIRYDMDVVGHGIKRLSFGLHTGLVMPAILRSADTLVFSSLDYARSSNAAWYLREAPDKCVEIPYGVDRNVFYPDKSALKRGDRLLFVGGLDRAHYFKGLERLLNTIATLSANRTVALHVVGNGDMADHYKDMCRQLQIERNVTFLTDCDNDQLRREYSEASATILPSKDRSEAFGLVLIESMACGTAVIASDLPGVRTIVEDGLTGYLIAPTDAVSAGRNSLEAVIASVLDNPERAASMGRSGLDRVAEKCDWQTIGRRLAELMAG